jgi:Flp pilus assembly protein TadB
LSSQQQRLQRVLAAPDAPDAGLRRFARPVLAVATALAGVLGMGGVVGIAVGLGTAAGVVLTGRRPERPVPADPDRVPVVVELIAGCLDAGLAMPAALRAASVAADPTTRDCCLASAAALQRGAPPAEAWQTWLVDPSLEPVARATSRTTQSGASVADDLRRVAGRMRARRHSRLQQRVQQASIWVVVPLGLFFMPAFVLIAVVPVVIGMFQHVR